MRVMDLPGIRGPKARAAAFTLAEVVICVFIMMLLFAGILTAYIQTSYRAEWSGYSLAAQALAIQQLEQAKAAVWDIQQTPVQNEFTNMPTVTYATLDLPVTGTNYVYATNFATVRLVPTSIAGVSNYMVKVDTVWPFRWKNKVILFTNTIADYYAPE
jgi:hypothetical protein